MDKLSEEEERICILKLRLLKKITLRNFSAEIRNAITKIIDELVCEVIFQIHMEINIGMTDPKLYSKHSITTDESLAYMTENLNITKVNQDIDCPKCCIMVKCLWLSKHLAVCMNPEQNTYSYSSRNSSRIARKRIQEGFKTSYDELKNDSDDERVRSKKSINKKRKAKLRGVR